MLLIKVNVDSAPAIAEKYEIASLPTVLGFDGNGKLVDSFVGSRDARFIKAFIDKLVSA